MSRTNRIPCLIILALTALLLAAPAAADPKNKGGKGKEKDYDVSATVSGSLDVSFGDGKSGYLSAGISFGDARKLANDFNLTGQKPLPPGIRKNMARGKPMPPGIAKSRMPDGFLRGLPRHDGYEWQQAGSDLVLVASGTLVISDILQDVFD